MDGFDGGDEKEDKEKDDILFRITAAVSEPLHCLCCFAGAEKANAFKSEYGLDKLCDADMLSGARIHVWYTRFRAFWQGTKPCDPPLYL